MGTYTNIRPMLILFHKIVYINIALIWVRTWTVATTGEQSPTEG